MEPESSSRTVDAVDTSLNIIQLLQKRDGARLTEIAAELDRSKGTIHCHLATLKQHDFVVKDGDEYRLSMLYLQLAETVKDRLQIYDVVRDELDNLVAECGELAQFAIEEHGQAVYIYKTTGENAIQTASRVGDRRHLHCLSLGKAMLAHMSRDRVEEIIARHGLPKYTDQTITSPESLFEQLETIREQGYAFDREEKTEGLRCVAAPVLVNGDIVGALSIAGPASRFKGDLYEGEYPELVTRSANIIEVNCQFL